MAPNLTVGKNYRVYLSEPELGTDGRHVNR